MIATLQRTLGLTVFMVTHDLDSLRADARGLDGEIAHVTLDLTDTNSPIVFSKGYTLKPYAAATAPFMLATVAMAVCGAALVL